MVLGLAPKQLSFQAETLPNCGFIDDTLKFGLG